VQADVVVVGAGIVGAACAEALTARGLSVLVVDRSGPAAGTTAAGEGNILVSDKEPGPELGLAVASRAEWSRVLERLTAELGPDGADVEWDDKGGLVVATTDPEPLHAFAATQRAAGIDARPLGRDEALDREPLLTPRVTAAVHYPDDAQLQPVLAATALLAAVRARGSEVRSGVTATGVRRTGSAGTRRTSAIADSIADLVTLGGSLAGVEAAGDRVAGVETSAGFIACGAVVNACGPWAGAFAESAGMPVAVLPRRGMILVTAPLPECVRHKVYDADYVGAVGSGEADLQTSTVVESTRAGTVLIGSSRERIGYDDSIRVRVLRELAAKAVALFPFLGDVPVLRAYGGFRPYAPDHLPVIGEDPRLPGLWHATGHEGAGIGLAASTGRLIAELLTADRPHVDPAPFRVDRPAVVSSGVHA
jgi:glycine/D-amino acid oxidase-like deaminating enzyme